MPQSWLLSAYFHFLPSADNEYVLAMPSHKMSRPTIDAVIGVLGSVLGARAQALRIRPEEDFYPTEEGSLSTSPYFCVAKSEYDAKIKPYMPDRIDLGEGIAGMLSRDAEAHSKELAAYYKRINDTRIRHATEEFIKRENSVRIPTPPEYSDSFFYFLANKEAIHDYEHCARHNNAPKGAVQSIKFSNCVAVHKSFLRAYISEEMLHTLPVAQLPYTAQFPAPEPEAAAVAVPAAASAEAPVPEQLAAATAQERASKISRGFH